MRGETKTEQAHDCVREGRESCLPGNAGQEAFIRRMREGIVAGGLRAYARKTEPCGLHGTILLEVCLDDDHGGEPLMCIAIYGGRPPHYRPWAEVFCVSSRPKCASLEYYDSPLEMAILEAVSEALGPGGRLFIEYYSDTETAKGLSRGFPAAATRQGQKLFGLGFTWFKDWYFSEGGHEGGQKLQGELPLDEAARARQMERMKAEVEAFLALSASPASPGDECLERAVSRAGEVLDKIDHIRRSGRRF